MQQCHRFFCELINKLKNGELLHKHLKAACKDYLTNQLIQKTKEHECRKIGEDDFESLIFIFSRKLSNLPQLSEIMCCVMGGNHRGKKAIFRAFTDLNSCYIKNKNKSTCMKANKVCLLRIKACSLIISSHSMPETLCAS